MVVHTPSKLDALRQTAANRRAGVPQSVLDAARDPVGEPQDALAAPDAPGAQAAASNAALLGDLLHQDDDAAIVHDFDTWDGNNPPGSQTAQVEINAVREDDNVTTRTTLRQDQLTKRTNPDAKDEDVDRISVASVSDVTPPPRTDPGPNFPPLNPFTPEWFAQIIGAAATAAATAVANTPRQSPSSSPSLPSSDSSGPRRLNAVSYTHLTLPTNREV